MIESYSFIENGGSIQELSTQQVREFFHNFPKIAIKLKSILILSSLS